MVKWFRKRKPTRGSYPVGPSDAYKRLLRGEITPEEYVADLKRRVKSRDF